MGSVISVVALVTVNEEEPTGSVGTGKRLGGPAVESQPGDLRVDISFL